MPDALRNTLFVAAGGALGTLFRHLLNVATFSPAFPVGTVIENITGAFLLGLVTGAIAGIKQAPAWLKQGVAVGFCGGYTTTSTFAADSFVLVLHDTPGLAGLYVAVSLIFGLLAAWTGLGAGRALLATERSIG